MRNPKITSDPAAYYNNGLNAHSLNKNEEAISWFDKAIKINPNDANYYSSKGQSLQRLNQDKEAIICYDKAIKINPNSRSYHSHKVLALLKLGRGQEAVNYYDQALEIEPGNLIYLEYKALALQRMDRDQEAKLCFDKIEQIKKSKEISHFDEGMRLQRLGKYQEAVVAFDKAIEINSENPLYYCLRGRILRFIERQKEAVIDFKKAQEILSRGSENEYLTRILNSVLGLQKDDERAGNILEQLDKNNLKVMKFVKNLKALQLTKEQVTTDLLVEIEKKDVEKLSEENIKTMWQLKEDYERFSQEMKEEVIREMDDLYEKFDTEIGSLDLSRDGQIRVKDYFTAFIRTFNSVFVASQAIESGQLQFGLGSILSAFASLAPFAGDTLPSEITSVDKLLSTKELKMNTKKILEPFSDSGYLNAVIGKTAYRIVLDKSKREEISSVTKEELDEKSFLLQKVSEFCEQMSEPIDVELYKKLYNTPAARLGHIDANYLIQEYCEGRISIERVQEEFVEKTLKRDINQVEAIEEVTHPTTPSFEKMKSKENDIGKGKCCSIF